MSKGDWRTWLYEGNGEDIKVSEQEKGDCQDSLNYQHFRSVNHYSRKYSSRIPEILLKFTFIYLSNNLYH